MQLPYTSKPQAAVTFKQRMSPSAPEMQNSVNPAYIMTMTLLELLQDQLQRAEETYGSDAPVTRMIRQEVEEMRQLSPGSQSETQDTGESGLINYHVGFRKARAPKGRKA
jgi:hypothetical protein